MRACFLVWSFPRGIHPGGSERSAGCMCIRRSAHSRPDESPAGSSIPKNQPTSHDAGWFLVCAAPNGVRRRVFALNGVRGDSINVFPMIPMRGACPSCTTSLYLPDVFCSNRFCGFFESLEVLACFNLKHKARPCFPRGTKGAFPISFYLVSDIGIVSIFARRAQEPDFFIIPL